MKRILFIILLISLSGSVFAQGVVYNDVKFNGDDLLISLSAVNVKTNDIVEAIKRGLEGHIEYTVQIVSDPLLPLMPKEVMRSVTVKRKVKFDFFNKAYVITRSNTAEFYYSDQLLIDELFSDVEIAVRKGYSLRKSNYRIRAKVSFSSVKLYFPLNLIFHYIVGIWDFDTGWVYGPKLAGVPYGHM